MVCDDTHTADWTRGWEKLLKRHALRSVRASSPQAAAVKTMVVDAFAQEGKLLDAKQSGQAAFGHIMRALGRGLSKALPGVVMQTPQKFLVPAGTSVLGYM